MSKDTACKFQKYFSDKANNTKDKAKFWDYIDFIHRLEMFKYSMGYNS